MYMDYRRTTKDAKRVAGFVQAAFLVGGPKTCFTVSIWADYSAIPRFGTLVGAHVDAARESMGRVRMSRSGGPEIWSTRWKLDAASNNLNWDDIDFRRVIPAGIVRHVG